MVGDETFHLIDGNCFIHAAAGAFLFAFLVADTSAYCRQRVFGFNKIQGFLVSSLSRHLQIALYGNVSRAGNFTGCRTGRHDVLAVLTVIGVPCGLGYQMIGQLGVFRHLQFGLGAEFLSETQCVCRAGFHTLCAGHTFGFIDLRNEVGTDRVTGTEHQADAESEACAGAAVADRSTLTGFLNVGNIMHQAVLFGAVNDLQRFFLADLTGTAGADIMFCTLTHLNTHLFRQVSASVIDGGTGSAAGAGRHAEFVILVEIIAESLIIMNIGNILDGALNGDNAHQTIAVGDER